MIELLNSSIIFLIFSAFLIMFFLNEKAVVYSLVFVIILLPKVNMLNIPGTYVAVRSEDFMVLTVSFLAVLYVLIRKKPPVVPRIMIPISIFVSAVFVSLIAGIYQGTIENGFLGSLFFIRKIEYLIPFFIAYLMFEKKDAAYLGRIFPITFFISAVIGLFQQFQLIGGFYLGIYAPLVVGRIFSTFSGPYEYSIFLALVFSYFLVEYLTGEKNKPILLLLLGAIFYMALLTAARIAVVSIVTVSILVAFSEKKIKSLLPLLTVLLVIALMLMPFTAKSRFQSFFEEGTLPALTEIGSGALVQTAAYSEGYGGGIDMSAVSRYIKWLNVFQGFSRHPFFGSGPSAFGEAVDGEYVRVLGESGIFGILAFAWLMYNLFMMSYKYYRRADSDELARKYSLFMLAALSVLLINALFIDVFEASKIAMLFWLLIGVQCKIIKQNKEEHA